MIDEEYTIMDAKQDNSRKSVNIFHTLKNTVVHHCDLQSILYFKLFLKLLNICAIFVLCYVNVFCKDTTLGALYVAALVVSIVNITNMFLAVKAFSVNFKANFDKYGLIFYSLADSIPKELISKREKQTEADDGISILDKIHIKEQLHFLKDVICLITLDAAILLVNAVCLVKDKDWSYVCSYKVEMYSLYTTIAVLTVESICMILRDPFLEEITGLKKLLKEYEEFDAAQDCSTNEITEDAVQTESAVNEVETSDNGIFNDSGFDDNVKDQKEIPFRKTDTHEKNNIEDDGTVDCNRKETSQECSIKEMTQEETTENEKQTETTPDSSIKLDQTKHGGKKNRKKNQNKKNKHRNKVQKSDNLTSKESRQKIDNVSTRSISDTTEGVKNKNLAEPSTRCKTEEDDKNKIHDPEPLNTSNTGEDLENTVEDRSNANNVEETDNSVDPPSGDRAVKDDKSRINVVHGPNISLNTDENTKQTDGLEGSSKKQNVKKTNSSAKLTSTDKSGEDQLSSNAADSSEAYSNTEEDMNPTEMIETSWEKQNVEKTDNSEALRPSDVAAEKHPSKNSVNVADNYSNTEEDMKPAETTDNSSEKQNVEKTVSSEELMSSDAAGEKHPSKNTTNGTDNYSSTEADVQTVKLIENISEKQNVEKTDSSETLRPSDVAGENHPSKNSVNVADNYSNTEEDMKPAETTHNSSEKQNVEKTVRSEALTSRDIDGEDQLSKNTVNSSENYSNTDEDMEPAERRDNILEKQNIEKTDSSETLPSIDVAGENQSSKNTTNSPENYSNTEEGKKPAESIDNSSEKQNVEKTDSLEASTVSDICGEDQSNKNTVNSSEFYSITGKGMKQAEVIVNISEKQNVKRTDSSAELTLSVKDGEDQRNSEAVDSSEFYSNTEQDMKQAEKTNSRSETKNSEKTYSMAELASSDIAGEDGVKKSGNGVKMESKMIKSLLDTEKDENNYCQSRVELTNGAFSLRFNCSTDNNLSFIYMKNPKGSRGVIADYYCKYDLSPRKDT